MRKVLFLINPAAQAGKAKANWLKLQRELDLDQILPEYHFTKEKGEAIGISEKYTLFDVVVVAGGDGTISEVVTGVMNIKGRKPAVAVLPVGSGNDLSRNLGIQNINEGIKLLLKDHRKQIDVFRIRCHKQGQLIERYGMVVCNAGFGATVFAMKYPWIKKRLPTSWSYYISSIVPLMSFKAPIMKIRLEDRKIEQRCWVVIASNNEWAGAGGMRLAPDARPDDGLIHTTIVSHMSKWRLLSKLTKLKTGAHLDDPKISLYQTKKIFVDCEPQCFVELDGDPIGETPLEIKICPRALEVIAPQI